MSIKIPINIPIIGDEEIKSVTFALKTGSLTSSDNLGGKFVQEFEKLAVQYVKSKYAIAVNSGTSALQAALLALNIKKGDEVMLPSFTFVATANAIVSTGAKPVFIDISKNNYTIDPLDLQKKITKRTKVIIPVHLYGHVSYIEEIIEIARKNNLKIIEDAAQSLGSTFKGKHTGTFSDIGCYSLYPAKVMTAGEGGFLVTNDKKIREKLLMIRNHGMVKGYDTTVFGLNLRMPEISAAIAKEQIKKLPKFLYKRKKNAKKLTDLISNFDLEIPFERKYEKRNGYLYTISTKNRDKIMKKLNANGIGAAVYYGIPVHKTPYYKLRTKLKETEWASSHVLSLPIQPLVREIDLVHMANIIEKETR